MRPVSIKVLGQVLVALMGLAGVVISLGFGDKTMTTEDLLKETVHQLQDNVIPSLEKAIKDQAQDLKEVAKVVNDLREKVAKLEGKLEARPMALTKMMERKAPTFKPLVVEGIQQVAE